MQINAMRAQIMLETMGYTCDALSYVADIPVVAVAALHTAWESLRQGRLQAWEIEQITMRMLDVVMESSRLNPSTFPPASKTGL